MKNSFYILAIISAILLMQCQTPQIKETSKYESVMRVDSGAPVSVMLTSYSTTLLANGKANTRMRVAVTDSLGREIATAEDSIRVYVAGDGEVLTAEKKSPEFRTDTSGLKYAAFKLENGICNLYFVAGTNPDKVKVEVKSGKLWPGAHEIHTLPADFVMMKPTPGQLVPTTKHINRMIGADISFLPQIEAQGGEFFDGGEKTDAVELLHNHGFNYIRLRIFDHPENENGYAPGKGYCDLDHTLEMAKRVKAAGMKLLLDFHYSDYWADPQQQYKPEAWKNLDFKILKDSVRSYTKNVLEAFQKENVLPDMVQVGNEINHGILWPDGHISHPDQLAELLQAGIKGVKAISPDIPVMMHLALGGQNKEARFWLDNMIARGVTFDIIGISYYPRWHGTLDDLDFNLNDLATRYRKPVNVVEYADFKKEVHDIVFSLPDDLGNGACIWEPLNQRSGLFDKDMETTPLMILYDSLHKKYLSN